MSESGPLMVDVAGQALTDEDRALLAQPLVGGLILFSRNFNNASQVSELISEIRKINPDILIAVDYEGGRVQRFREGVTRLPPMRALGRQYDQDASAALANARDLGWLIAVELGALDIDLPLTPVVDLDYDRCAVIGDRALHQDPQIVTRLAAAIQNGLAEGGMQATAKHFPGHGAVAEDSHTELPVDERGRDALTPDLEPYSGLIAQGLGSVMMAHIRYPALDTQPASLSRYWIAQVLREELGFAGAVFCDDLSMGGAAVAGTYTERARLALQAGCDILPVCNNRAAVNELISSLSSLAPDPAAARRRAALRRRQAAVPPDAERLACVRAQMAALAA